MTIDLKYGAAEDVLKTLPDGSIGHVVVDPPYGQTNEAYDSPIAFAPAIWRECYRVTGPDAALVSFAGGPTYHRIASAIEAGGWKVRQMWGWVYREGMITSAYPREGFDRLAPAMDPIVFATKGKVLLRLEREGEAWAKEDSSGWSRKRIDVSGRTCNRRALRAAGHWPRAITSDGSAGFEFFALPRAGPKPEGRTGHPNQKPLALMRWIVSKLPHTGPILDPFAGSGTTGLAAEAHGFDAVLIEQNSEYCEIIRRRIAATRTEQPLFDAAI